MKHWVLKARPSYDFAAELGKNRVDDWEALPASGDIRAGDRVFLWASSPALRIAGLGEVIKPAGKHVRVRYLTSQLELMPGIRYLQIVSSLKGANFLKPRHGTAFPLNEEQAKELYGIISKLNPGIHPWSDWPKGQETIDSEYEAIRENTKLVPHLRRERDPQVARKKKADFRLKHGGRLFCEACSKEHAEYGALTSDIFEVHHRLPLSKAKGPVKTHLTDLAVLCPNCHRAIHRTKPMITVQVMAKRLRKA